MFGFTLPPQLKQVHITPSSIKLSVPDFNSVLLGERSEGDPSPASLTRDIPRGNVYEIVMNGKSAKFYDTNRNGVDGEDVFEIGEDMDFVEDLDQGLKNSLSNLINPAHQSLETSLQRGAAFLEKLKADGLDYKYFPKCGKGETDDEKANNAISDGVKKFGLDPGYKAWGNVAFTAETDGDGLPDFAEVQFGDGFTIKVGGVISVIFSEDPKTGKRQTECVDEFSNYNDPALKPYLSKFNSLFR